MMYLGIENHANGFFQFGGLIDEDVAETVRVTHDWNTGAILDGSHKGVASPWDYQVDVPVEGKESRDIFSCVYGLDVRFWEGGGRQRTLDHGG